MDKILCNFILFSLEKREKSMSHLRHYKKTDNTKTTSHIHLLINMAFWNAKFMHQAVQFWTINLFALDF